MTKESQIREMRRREGAKRERSFSQKQTKGKGRLFNPIGRMVKYGLSACAFLSHREPETFPEKKVEILRDNSKKT